MGPITRSRSLPPERLPNGDGFVDLIVGARLQDNPERNEGVAFLVMGAIGGPSSIRTRALDNPDDQEDGAFGESVTGLGDIDGDGYADVLVGAHFQDAPLPFQGMAYLFYGGVDGVSEDVPIAIESPEPQEESRYGGTVAGLGDIDGDGFCDFAIAAPSQNRVFVDEGLLFVFLGGPRATIGARNVQIESPEHLESSQFGRSVSGTTDLDADGLSETLGGSPLLSNPEYQEGTVFIWFGALDFSPTSPDITLDSPTGEERGWFGLSSS